MNRLSLLLFKSPLAQKTTLPMAPIFGRRFFHSGSAAMQDKPPSNTDTKEKVPIVFIDQQGTKKLVRANVGESLLEIAHKNEIEMEGACEGSLACSTCHVYLSQKHYDMIEPPNDEENDMLDLAFALTERSRLGCQIKVCKELEGMEVTLPHATRNMAVDGYVPKPH